jgi:serine/threonine protein kinase
MTTTHASIEQLYDEDPLPAFDIWSGGIILYELMSGKLPYETKKNNQAKMIEFIRQHQRQPLPDSYSKELRDLVDSMLNINIE